MRLGIIMIDLIMCQLISFLIAGVIGSIVYIIHNKKVKKRKKLEEYFYCPECGNKVIK